MNKSGNERNVRQGRYVIIIKLDEEKPSLDDRVATRLSDSNIEIDIIQSFEKELPLKIKERIPEFIFCKGASEFLRRKAADLGIILFSDDREIPGIIKQMTLKKIDGLIARPVILKEELDSIDIVREKFDEELEDLNIEAMELQEQMRDEPWTAGEARERLSEIEARKKEIKTEWEGIATRRNELLREKAQLESELIELSRILVEEDGFIQTMKRCGLPYRDFYALVSLDAYLRRIDRARDLVRRTSLEEFWRLYEKVAYIFCTQEDLADCDRERLRLFLRYGVFSEREEFFEPKKIQFLKQHIASEGEPSCDFQHGQAMLLYCDEYLERLIKQISPTPRDGISAERRRYEATWRYLKVIEKDTKALEQVDTKAWQKEIEALESDLSHLNEKIAALRRNTRRTPQEDAALKESLAKKPTIIRQIKDKQRLLSLLSSDILIKKSLEKEECMRELSRMQAEFLARREEGGFEQEIEKVIAREINELRSWIRLCKGRGGEEPNPAWFVESSALNALAELRNDRASLLAKIRQVENIDKEIFTRHICVNKVRVGLTRREPPIFVILPMIGERGFCRSPADAWQAGRIAVPMMWKSRASKLSETLGQFRFQSIKEEAGMDWMLTDNLANDFDRWYRQVKKNPTRRDELGLKRGLTIFAFMTMYGKFISAGGEEYWCRDKELRDIFRKYLPHS